MPADWTFWIAFYGAALSTVLLGWDVYKFLQKPKLVIRIPTIGTSEFPSGDEFGHTIYYHFTTLTIPISNPGDKLAHAETVFLVPEKGNRIKLEQMNATASSAVPFDVDPFDAYKFIVRGNVLAQNLESAGYKGNIQISIIVQDRLGNEFKSKSCPLSIDSLKKEYATG